MHRFVPLASLAVLGLAVCAASAEAGKKNRKAGRNMLVGTITAVNGKSITVTALGRKKKQPGPTVEVKLGERTTITYLGLDSKDEQKLAVGLFVMVALDGQDSTTAKAIAAG